FRAVGCEPHSWRHHPSGRGPFVLEHVVNGADVAGDGEGLATVGEVPDDALIPYVGGHLDREDTPVSAGAVRGDRVEVSRLPTVVIPRLDVVVGTQRDIDGLVRIHVVVPEGEAVATVRVRVPPLEDGCDDLAGR